MGPTMHKSKETLAREELEKYLDEKNKAELEDSTTEKLAEKTSKKPHPSFFRSINLDFMKSNNTGPSTHPTPQTKRPPFKLVRNGVMSQESVELFLLRRKILDMKHHYERYLNISVNDTLVRQYKQHHMGGIARGRAVAPAGNTTTAKSATDDGKDPFEGHQQAKEDIEKQKQKKSTISTRVWGDECVPDMLNDGRDECYEYTSATYGDDNSRLLSCDYTDRICLCIMDDMYRRAEYSKELEICLVPEHYRCNFTSQCAPLLVCAKATKRDYEVTPDIPQGFPNICRRTLDVPPNGSLREAGDYWMVFWLLFISSTTEILMQFSCCGTSAMTQ